MRQYWRDYDTLEAGRAPSPTEVLARRPARRRGSGFWHEADFMRGGAEAIYAALAMAMGSAPCSA